MFALLVILAVVFFSSVIQWIYRCGIASQSGVYRKEWNQRDLIANAITDLAVLIALLVALVRWL